MISDGAAGLIGAVERTTSGAAAITIVVWATGALGLAYPGWIKDAVVWAVVAGLPLLSKFDAVARQPGLLRHQMGHALRLTAVVEFFVNLYVFPLPVELGLQALIALLVMASAVAATDNGTEPARRLFDTVLSVAGIVLLVLVVRHIVADGLGVSLRVLSLSYLQPVILTSAILGLTFAVLVFSAYEQAFMRLTFPQTGSPARLRHRLALVVGLHPRTAEVSQFADALPARLRRTRTLRDSLALVRAYRRGVIGPTDWDFADGTA